MTNRSLIRRAIRRYTKMNGHTRMSFHAGPGTWAALAEEFPGTPPVISNGHQLALMVEDEPVFLDVSLEENVLLCKQYLSMPTLKALLV